jgi:hypothetical protein
MAKQQKPKKEPKPKKPQNQSVDLEVIEEVIIEGESAEKEVIVKSFVPRERKDSNQILHKGWYDRMHPDAVKHMLPMIEHSYADIKKRWEIEERISKQRKEYLQGLYDKMEDLRIVHANNQKK